MNLNWYASSIFDCFEEHESILSHVEVNVVFGFIGNVGSKVSADEAVPVSIILPVEFILEVGGYLLNGVHFVESVSSYGQDLSLHLGTDVFDFDDGFWVFGLCH